MMGIIRQLKPQEKQVHKLLNLLLSGAVLFWLFGAGHGFCVAQSYFSANAVAVLPFRALGSLFWFRTSTINAVMLRTWEENQALIQPLWVINNSTDSEETKICFVGNVKYVHIGDSAPFKQSNLATSQQIETTWVYRGDRANGCLSRAKRSGGGCSWDCIGIVKMFSKILRRLQNLSVGYYDKIGGGSCASIFNLGYGHGALGASWRIKINARSEDKCPLNGDQRFPISAVGF